MRVNYFFIILIFFTYTIIKILLVRDFVDQLVMAFNKEIFFLIVYKKKPVV